MPQSENLINNKTIARNTILLYCRMFLTLLVGLFTSRVILNSLGFVDYGIYNVVGGIVTMLTFLNVGMTGSSQRFLSYELGKGNKESLKTVFCTSVLTHASIAIIGLVLLETFGVWFLNYKLNIPPDRIYASNWVFQCSLATFVISVISVPYNSCIIAHERMGIYAYISIYEVIMRLIIAYCITITPMDRLILYAILLLVLQLSVRFIYTIYCRRHFEECHYRLVFDRLLFLKMFSFAGWGCVGNLGFSFKDQASNIILNLFYGTTLNAARGIATHVNGIINGFASNFTMAMNPQITKLYASGNYEESRDLAYAGSKYAFFLLMLLTIPFITNRNYILTLWLGKIPEYTDIFVTIILVASIIYSMSHTISTAILATGRVKWFQILLSLLLLLEIPAAWIILKIGGKPYEALYPALFTNFLSLILRILILRKINAGYSLYYYMKSIVFRCLSIFSIVLVISIFVKKQFTESFVTVILCIIISILLTIIFIYFFGLSRKERQFVKTKIGKKILNK